MYVKSMMERDFKQAIIDISLCFKKLFYFNQIIYWFVITFIIDPLKYIYLILINYTYLRCNIQQA